jgi:hypothetical protein
VLTFCDAPRLVRDGLLFPSGASLTPIACVNEQALRGENDALAPHGLIPCHVVNTQPADLRHDSGVSTGCLRPRPPRSFLIA